MTFNSRIPRFNVLIFITQLICLIRQSKKIKITFNPLGNLQIQQLLSMNQSRSLDAITTELLSTSQMQELSPQDKKFIMNQFKKMYSQQMSKVAAQLNRRNTVKNNKTDLEEKQENQIRVIQQNIMKKMEQHNKKRQKIFSSKQSHYKLLEQNWKLRMEQIQRKKKEQYKKSLEKSAKYRKQAQTFWSQNQSRNKSRNNHNDSFIPVVQNDGYFSIKTGESAKLLRPSGELSNQFRKKSQSKNQLAPVHKSLLPNIQKKSYYINVNDLSKKTSDRKNVLHTSPHKLVNEKSIQQHIEKSKNLSVEREQFALQKALEKLKMIELKREKCRKNIEKTVKQAKIKRELREDASLRAERREKYEQDQIHAKHSKQKRTQRKSGQQELGMSRSRSRNSGSFSLSQSIIKHKQVKQQLEEQKFEQRGQVLKANIMKQKKGKMLRMVKQTINKLKQQALKDST